MLKTHEFRAKDFLVRSTRSFERLEMQILYRQSRILSFEIGVILKCLE